MKRLTLPVVALLLLAGLLWAAPAPAGQTILFATDPDRHPGNGHPEPVSVIPADVRAACDVDDVYFSGRRDAASPLRGRARLAVPHPPLRTARPGAVR